MDKKNLIQSFLAAAAAGGIVLSAHGTDYLIENFDSYNTGDLTPQGGWSTQGSSLQVTTAQSASGPNSLFAQANTTGERNLILFDTIDFPTDENIVSFSVDFLDTNPDAEPYPQFATVQSAFSQGNAAIVYLGLNNNLSSSDQGGNYYMGGILNHDGGAFFKLNEGGASVRTDDWVTLSVEISATEFNFYVNDVLAKTVTSTLAAANNYDRVRLGSGAADPGTDAYYDNVTVSTVPEPGTYAAIFGGLSLFGALAYRRRRHSLES